MKPIPLLFYLTLLQRAQPCPEATPSPSGINWVPLRDVAQPVAILLVIIVLGYWAWWVLRNQKNKDSHQGLFEPAPQRIESDPIHPQHTNESQDAPLRKRSQPQRAKDSDATPAIFISYRRDDSSDVTGRIYDRLVQHFGKQSVFKDVDSIPLGADFRKHLGDSVGRCDVLLTVIGRQWLIGDVGQRRLDDIRDFVRIELEAALQRDIPIVPVLVQAAPVPRVEDLPETLQSLVDRNGISVRPDPDFHHDMDRLIKGIEGYLTEKGINS